MLTLWPVVLIAVGIGLLVPREAEVARTSVALIAVTALAVGGWFVDQTQLPSRGRSAEVEIPLAGAIGAEVELEVGAGRVSVTGGADAGDAVSGVVGLSRGQRLVADGAESDGVAQVRVAAEGRWFRLGLNPDRVAPWDLRIAQDVPVSLRLSSGVGEAELDLRNVLLEEARIDVGLGRTVVRLPNQGRPRVRVDGGMGEVLIRIPDSIPARVAVDAGFGPSSVEGVFRREGDVYTTSGWEDAEERLDVTVETGVGSVRVIRR